MLLAHLVPGYFAAVKTESQTSIAWSGKRKWGIWFVALFSTVAPDLDVIYNGVIHHELYHSTLWTHSIFVHLTIALAWLCLRILGRWRYLQTLMGLAAFGGLSHVLLDTFAHGTIFLYPTSMRIFVMPFAVRALQGGIRAYLTDPLFLVELFLLTLPLVHLTTKLNLQPRARKLFLVALYGGYILFSILFLVFLPMLQKLIEPFLPAIK